MASPMMEVHSALDVVVPGLAASGLAFLFIGYLYTRIASFPTGKDIQEPKIDELSLQIKQGSKAFLKTEYKFLTVFVVALACTLFALFMATTNDIKTALSIALSFVFGATLSGSAGWWGMMVATDGNAKTTAAAAGDKKGSGKKGSLNAGLTVAFTTGAVMGFAVVGLGLLGVCVCYLTLAAVTEGGFESPVTMQCLAGFGFGASSIALFARVAGGIYTKAADVGADLVGKVEAGIDEDDPVWARTCSSRTSAP
jgi:Na+/H+-translocating membrane pyrophosphatase